MKTAFFTHQLSLLHDMGPGHPENPDRLRAISAALSETGFAKQLVYKEPGIASRDQLERIHDAGYLDDIFARSPGHGLVHLDGDTAMNPHSLQCALLAAGAVINATDLVVSGEIDNAFCCMRPPGHHAEHNRAMGFCLFGNVAAGAAHALESHEIDRVAILDFDVHHGNGTENIFRNDPRVLFCSSFQHPFYPYPDLHNAPANIVHAPLASGSGSKEFREAISQKWLPVIARHRPQMIFVSAGFDAHRDDPLGGLALEDDDFSWISKVCRDLASEHCDNRLVSTLEGGYEQSALARCVLLHLEQLLADNEN